LVREGRQRVNKIGWIARGCEKKRREKRKRNDEGSGKNSLLKKAGIE
jgi:hypothetical protein